MTFKSKGWEKFWQCPKPVSVCRQTVQPAWQEKHHRAIISQTITLRACVCMCVPHRWVFPEINECILFLLFTSKIPTDFQMGNWRQSSHKHTVGVGGSSKLRCPRLRNICWRAGTTQPCRDTQDSPCRSTQRRNGGVMEEVWWQLVTSNPSEWKRAQTHIPDHQLASRNDAAFSILSLKSLYIHTQNVLRSFYHFISTGDVTKLKPMRYKE